MCSSPPQLRILVVDDDEMVRNTLKRILQYDRHAVEEAGGANVALDMLKRERFDLVITDYDMPGMKGDALAAAIKSLVPTQPVMMVTAYVETVPNNPSVMKNLDGLVPKPFWLDTLREAIAQAVAGRRQPADSPNP